MKKLLTGVSVAALFFLTQSVSAQTKTNTAVLRQASVVQAEKEKQLKVRIVALAKEKKLDLIIRKPKGGIMILTDIDGFGNPVYTATDNNIAAAATIGTNQLWAGGSLGLNLNGSSTNVKGKLAVWDGGLVRPTHVELAGRVTQVDGVTDLEDHATHVAGTLIASGVNPLAKGMSFGQQELRAYDFDLDNSEMLAAAPNLLVSSHSYGTVSGWVFNFNQNRWEFYGQPGANEDFQFGYYDSRAQIWDSIAWNSPNYLIVKSAGNKRDENGPAPGATYWRRNASGTFVSGLRPATIYSNDSYDIIPAYGNAKNILTVGAVEPLIGGYHRPQDVVMSSFSSWGPTDDGRIKPDVVADGVNLLSSISTSDNAYDIYSGTSMATPSVAGSVLLLQEYWNQLHPGQFMRSATLKGLVIHTADETGLAPGPDYQYGYGLVNLAKAASVITAANSGNKFLIQESELSNGNTATVNVVASGEGTLTATLCWTDPKASVEPTGSALDNTTSKLVDDLDIKIKNGANTYLPWTLSPSVPDAAAVRGINSLDNVEKIEVSVNDLVPGETYTIEITHKGVLQRGTQAYSLIVSGVGGVAYCASNPTSNLGSKIDSVSFATTQKKNIAGCTTYTSYLSLAPGAVEPGSTIPFFARLRTCDAGADKVVKVFIDGNNDGDFTDAGENVATSAVINGDGDFTSPITIPAGLVPGKYAVLRVVMVETNNAASVLPCGTYAKGETQDYRIFVATASNDVGITELVSPDASDCGLNAQYVSVRIHNYGNAPKSNIPVTVVVKQGATTVATINGTYPNTIEPAQNAVYTLQTPFTSVAGTTYTITSSTLLAGDQSAANNQNISTVSIRPNETSTGTATVCSSSANTILQAAVVTGAEAFTWYTAAAATTPIATGSNTSTTVTSPNFYLGKNEVSQHLGAASKMAFPTGSYFAFTGQINQLRAIFKTQVPMTIQTARMYIGQPGRILTRLVRLTTDFNYLNGDVEGFYFTDHPLDVYASSPTTPAPNVLMNDPLDLGNIYHLGINIPEAGTWALIVEDMGTSSIYRNREITSPTNYPYSVPGIITLEGNGAVDSVSVNYNKGFYYFWYDMAVKVNGCSAPRTAIVPTTPAVPTISVAGNVFTSSSATGNQWYKDGVLIPGEVSNNYTATSSGNYTVATTTNGCTLTSAILNFVFTSVQNVDPNQIGLVVTPVPARGRFKMQLETRTKADLDISLISTNGQQVYHKAVHGFIGQYSDFVEPRKAAAGVYYLRVVHDNKMYIRKVIMVE